MAAGQCFSVQTGCGVGVDGGPLVCGQARNDRLVRRSPLLVAHTGTADRVVFLGGDGAQCGQCLVPGPVFPALVRTVEAAAAATSSPTPVISPLPLRTSECGYAQTGVCQRSAVCEQRPGCAAGHLATDPAPAVFAEVGFTPLLSEVAVLWSGKPVAVRLDDLDKICVGAGLHGRRPDAGRARGSPGCAGVGLTRSPRGLRRPGSGSAPVPDVAFSRTVPPTPGAAVAICSRSPGGLSTSTRARSLRISPSACVKFSIGMRTRRQPPGRSSSPASATARTASSRSRANPAGLLVHGQHHPTVGWG